MNKTRLQGRVYGFSVDYDAVVVSDILDICKYLINKKKKKEKRKKEYLSKTH